MRILILTHAFNSLSQRLYVELAALGHALSVEFDISDAVTEEAVELYRPDLLLAPFLRRAIPRTVWSRLPCLVLHPGVRGDRGPSALDRAILRGEASWGVTLLQAEAGMDTGPVWASETFPMRIATKSSLYRNEVTEAAVIAVKEALDRFPEWRAGRWQPEVQPGSPLLPVLTLEERKIAWQADSTELALRKLRASDGFPGVMGELLGQPCRLFDAHEFPSPGNAPRGRPGELLGRSGEGLVVATTDGALWLGHIQPLEGPQAGIKLPAIAALGHAPGWGDLPELPGAPDPVRYEERGELGVLHFDFHNGAMATADCMRLKEAWLKALERPTRVLVLAGGRDFFSNGLDLKRIEAAASPSDESWANIQAMDDLCRAVIETTDRLTVALLQGNAGAGGAFLALAADRVWLRRGVVLNPHYKNMGNLYGSEYWTYLLPRRLGQTAAEALMARRLPLGAAEAVAMGFADAVFDQGPDDFLAAGLGRAAKLARDPALPGLLQAKQAMRRSDEAEKPLAHYRSEELAHMQRNFYGFDPSYHVARHHFVRRTPHSWTPRHLARHRDLGWEVPEDAA